MLMMAAVRYGPALGFGIRESVVYRRMRYRPGVGCLVYTVVCGSIMWRLVAGIDGAKLQLLSMTRASWWIIEVAVSRPQ